MKERYIFMTYEIVGTPLPVVTCTLQAGEKMITESGAMCWMSPNMQMETSTNGGLGKAFGRMFSGESMFQNIYTAQGGQGIYEIQRLVGQQHTDTGILDDVGNLAVAQLEVDGNGNRPQGDCAHIGEEIIGTIA